MILGTRARQGDLGVSATDARHRDRHQKDTSDVYIPPREKQSPEGVQYCRSKNGFRVWGIHLLHTNHDEATGETYTRGRKTDGCEEFTL